jgi:zinc protease
MTSKPTSFPGPHDITRTVFDNGLTVLVRENHAAPVAVLEGYLPAGAIYEPVEKTGVSHFVASMLTRGSANYDFDLFNESIESIGANLAVGSETHATAVASTSLSEDLPRMITILADVLRRPTFPAEHMERVRQQTLVGIQERDQDTQRAASLRFYETLFPSHPYGRAITGYAETVSAICRGDLVDFYSSHFTPNGAVIVVVGDVQTTQVMDLLHHRLGDWHGPARKPEISSVATLSQTQQIMMPMPGKVQSDIVLGCVAPSRSHPD